MTNYCRLCAGLKDPDEIASSITDTEYFIEQKLKVCCQWNVENNNPRLPQDVCTCCLDKLDKCWLFSQSVQSAQQELLEIFDNEIGTDSETKAESVEVSFDCTVCLHSFSSRDALREHDCNKRTAIDQCSLCHKTFKSLDGLRIHYKKQNDYTCRICSKVFCESNALKKHKQQQCENMSPERKIDISLEYDIDEIKVELPDDNIGSIVDENPLLVPIETNIATSISNHHTQVDHKLWAPKMQKSLLKNDVSEQYDCYLCNHRFRKFLFLKRHMEIHSLPKALKCNYCHAKFRSNRALNCHKSKHKIGVPPKRKVKKPSNKKSDEDNNNPKYHCYLCKKKFAKFEYVKGHMVVHSIPKTLKCQYCHLKFRIKRYLNQHSRIHIDFTCDFCDKHFTSERTLRLHRRVHVGDSSKLYGCETCDHFFKDLSTYCQHMWAKHGLSRSEAKQIAKIVEPNGTTKEFVCEQCGKDFREEWALKNHKLVHKDVRDHICDICSKGFKSKYMLEQHKKVHFPKKFECDFCGKAYTRKESIIAHMEIHTRVSEEFPCDLCNQTFSSANEMEYHRRIHTGAKRFGCDVCKYASKWSGDFYKHLRTPLHLKRVKESSELQK